MNQDYVKLKDCCVSIADGDHQSLPKADAGVPFITIANIDNFNTIDFTDTMYVPLSYYDKLDDKRKAQKNDILYSVVGSFGKPVFITNNTQFVFQRHIAILRPDTKMLCPRFLYYTMLTREFYGKADAVAIGAAQRTISLKSLRDLAICLPNLNKQKRIVDILEPYDELIKCNRQQIKLLEEAAQRLYKEWFEDLHFPGYENTPIVDGVPEGWTKKKLVDIVDVLYGYAFDGTLFNSNHIGMPILRIRNIPIGQTDDYTTEKADPKYIIQNGDIVVGMDGEFHINSWGGSPAYLVQRSCCFRPHNANMKGFLIQAIRGPIKFYENTVVGATVSHLGKKHIDKIEILCSPKDMYEPFQTLFEKRQVLINQNRNLLEARDLLLPRLMSGEITV